MSTIEPSTQGMVVPKQIGRRVMEIMEEKGKAFTQQALATRIGMGRQTLAMKLRGERDMYLFELRRIAEALHLPLERILQEDTRDDEKKLNGMFASLLETESTTTPPDFDDMLLIAQRLSTVAIGMTERCKTLNDMGRAYYYLRHYNEAHKTFTTALEHANNIAKKYNNNEYHNLTLSNLLLILTLIPTRIESFEILDDIEQAFIENPHRLGVIYYVRLKIAEAKGEIQEAKLHAKKSLECFQQTGNEFSIGKAEVTVAHFEFIDGNYASAKEYLNRAIGKLRSHTYEWLISVKEYAKTLLKLQEFEQVEKVIVDTILEVEHIYSKYSDIVGKLYLLLSMSRNDPSNAESVLFNKRVNVDVRCLAYQFLKRHCIENGDKDTLMKYAIIEDELGTIKRDLLDEEMF